MKGKALRLNGIKLCTVVSYIMDNVSIKKGYYILLYDNVKSTVKQ